MKHLAPIVLAVSAPILIVGALSFGPAVRDSLAPAPIGPEPVRRVEAAELDRPDDAALRDRAGVAPELDGTGFYALPRGRAFEMTFAAEFLTGLEHSGSGQSTRLDFELAGDLEAVVLDTNDSDLVLQLTIAGTRVGAEAGGDVVGTEQAQELGASLDGTYLVRMGRDGATLGFRFPEDCRGEVRNLVRSLWFAQHFVVHDGVDQWDVLEADATGHCRVVYARVDSDEEGIELLTKAKLPSDVAPGSGADARPEIRASGGEGALDLALRWPLRATYAEEYTLSVPEAELAVEYESDVSLVLEASGSRALSTLATVDWDAPWDDPSGEHETSGGEDVHRQSSFGRDLSLLEVEDLVHEIAALIAAGELGSRELYDAQRALAELLRTDPEALELLAELLRDPLLAGEVGMVVLAAVGQAQTSEAQAFLADVLRGGDSTNEHRVQATHSMFQLDNPGPVAVSSVYDAMHSDASSHVVRETAMLALGTFAARGAAPVDVLLEHEEEAQADDELVVWLEALGNSGSPAIIATVEPYLTHAKDKVRAAAVSALRLVAVPEATALLARSAREDSSITVRAGAAGYLGVRTDAEANVTLAEILELEPSATVRRAALLGIAARQPLDAAGVQLLVFTRDNDPSAELRELAQNVLTG